MDKMGGKNKDEFKQTRKEWWEMFECFLGINQWFINLKYLFFFFNLKNLIFDSVSREKNNSWLEKGRNFGSHKLVNRFLYHGRIAIRDSSLEKTIVTQLFLSCKCSEEVQARPKNNELRDSSWDMMKAFLGISVSWLDHMGYNLERPKLVVVCDRFIVQLMLGIRKKDWG